MSIRKLVILVALVVAGAALASCASNDQPYSMASESSMPTFVHNLPARAQQAYRFAVANQHELAKYPCYCGCGAMGHMSNLGCYIKEGDTAGTLVFDQHAAGCGICVDITQDVMRLLREGKSSREIRAYIDATYSSFGPGTNTPLPV